MNKRIILTLILAIVMATECLAWGQIGHDATSAIAENHLTKKAKKKISKILNGKSILYWSNWMDNACHRPEHEYALSWHYKNIEQNEKYEDVEPIETGDIITALNDLTARLNAHNMSKDEEALALKMFVHLIGDLHQPMHLAHKSDLGANKINVKFFGHNTNLHHVWDEDLIEKGHRWTYNEWCEQLDRVSKDEIKQIVAGTYDDWAKESLAYSRKIYDATPSNTIISYDYVADWTPVVEERLLSGGIRLAYLLNKIYK